MESMNASRSINLFTPPPLVVDTRSEETTTSVRTQNMQIFHSLRCKQIDASTADQLTALFWRIAAIARNSAHAVQAILEEQHGKLWGRSRRPRPCSIQATMFYPRDDVLAKRSWSPGSPRSSKIFPLLFPYRLCAVSNDRGGYMETSLNAAMPLKPFRSNLVTLKYNWTLPIDCLCLKRN